MQTRFEGAVEVAQAEPVSRFNNISEQMLSDVLGPRRTPERVTRNNLAPVDTSKPVFKPTSVDIDQFLNTERISYGLNKSSLKKISQDAWSAGDTRRQRTADFLETHFDDVSALSFAGKDRLTRQDLQMYQGFLRQNELKDNPRNPPIEDWKKIHFDHETSLNAYPMSFEMGLNLVAYTAARLALKVPAVAEKVGPTALTNPGKFLGIVVPSAFVAATANHFAAKGISNSVSRSWNGQSINTHFYDEAAPAMKRLLGK